MVAGRKLRRAEEMDPLVGEAGRGPDPAERHQPPRALPRLLLELAHGTCLEPRFVLAVAVVDRAAGEGDVAGEEPARAAPFDDEHLRSVVPVPHGDHRGGEADRVHAHGHILAGAAHRPTAAGPRAAGGGILRP